MSDLAIRTGTPDDVPAIQQLLATVFLTTSDPEMYAIRRDSVEPERSLVIYDGDELVAHTGAFTRDLTVPGGPMPACHVSMVGTVPTHRRQGLLRRLMQRQLAEAPEPIAVLWASEGRIYPRFGYGVASARVSLQIDSPEVRLPEPVSPGRVRTLPADRASTVLPPVYESVRADRPGWSSRNDVWWRRVLADPPSSREGATELRVTVHEGAGGVDGYALWRAKNDWDDSGPRGEVRVKEVVTADPDAYLRLWRLLLTVDLSRRASLWLSGPDEPLLHLADEPRRLGALLGDGLMVRVVDLPAALSGRRYAAPLDVVLEVSDPLLPANAGRWRLTTDAGKATCARTDDAADLGCDIADLGAVFLGGTSWGALALAGRVRELNSGALAAASAAFGWHRAPAGLEIF